MTDPALLCSDRTMQCDKCRGYGVEIRMVSPPIIFRQEPNASPVCTITIKCDKCHGTGKRWHVTTGDKK